MLAKWQKIVERCQAQPSSALSISIIGGGAGGIELALNMHQRLSHILPAQLLTINLIHRGQRILSHQNERASKLLTNILKQKQINLYLNTEIEEIKSAEIITKSQQTINCNYTFVVTNAQPASWLQKTQKKRFYFSKRYTTNN